MISTMNVLHNSIADVLTEYLGPTAERFLDRQINFHLSKPPDELQKADIPVLVNWLKISMGILTENKGAIAECIRRIEALE